MDIHGSFIPGFPANVCLGSMLSPLRPMALIFYGRTMSFLQSIGVNCFGSERFRLHVGFRSAHCGFGSVRLRFEKPCQVILPSAHCGFGSVRLRFEKPCQFIPHSGHGGFGSGRLRFEKPCQFILHSGHGGFGLVRLLFDHMIIFSYDHITM